MGYKPFVVGLIAAITVGFISLIYIETLIKFILDLAQDFIKIFFLKFDNKTSNKSSSNS